MPHATCHANTSNSSDSLSLPPTKSFARRGSLSGIRQGEQTTYSFILAAPQFTITIIFSSFVWLSLSLSLWCCLSLSLRFLPFWRLRRIKIAAVSSKSQKLQRQHQFSTRQRIFRHLSTQFPRANFGAKAQKKS